MLFNYGEPLAGMTFSSNEKGVVKGTLKKGGNLDVFLVLRCANPSDTAKPVKVDLKPKGEKKIANMEGGRKASPINTDFSNRAACLF